MDLKEKRLQLIMMTMRKRMCIDCLIAAMNAGDCVSDHKPYRLLELTSNVCKRNLQQTSCETNVIRTTSNRLNGVNIKLIEMRFVHLCIPLNRESITALNAICVVMCMPIT